MSKRYGVINIGMKYSGKELILEESKIGRDKYKQFVSRLGRAMDGKKDGVDLLDDDNDYLYVSFDSVAYVYIVYNFLNSSSSIYQTISPVSISISTLIFTSSLISLLILVFIVCLFLGESFSI